MKPRDRSRYATTMLIVSVLWLLGSVSVGHSACRPELSSAECAPGVAHCTVCEISSNDPYWTYPLESLLGGVVVLGQQLDRLNQPPPAFSGAYVPSSNRLRDVNSVTGVNVIGTRPYPAIECSASVNTPYPGCNGVPNLLAWPYVAIQSISGVDEITWNNSGSAWYRYSFQLPVGFQNARVQGVATVDDQGVAWLNGYPVSGMMHNPGCNPINPLTVNGSADPCFAQQDWAASFLGGQIVENGFPGYPAKRVLSIGVDPDPFDSSDLPPVPNLYRAGDNDLVFAVMGDASFQEPTGMEFRGSVSFTLCGNGYQESGEACDQGASNGTPGSCCAANCTLRTASHTCRSASGACDVAETCNGASPVCPVDGFVPDQTPCDDGSACTLSDVCEAGICSGASSCGNGVVEAGCEKCDRGTRNGQPGSGCSNECLVIGRCTVSQTECATPAHCGPGEGCCGNAMLDAGEQCDDGNLSPGDCCSPGCQAESFATCTPSLCSELGIYGPHVLSATEKLSLTDAKIDGTMERWGKTGDFNLFSGQSVNPATERVVIAISENDGANGRVELHRATLEPTSCAPASSCFVPNRAGNSWRYRDSRNAADPLNACGLETGTIRKASGNKIKFQIKGKSDASDACAYGFPRPEGTILREDIVIGDECATVLLDCRVFGGNKTYRCVPRP